jgi:hypothetical protein
MTQHTSVTRRRGGRSNVDFAEMARQAMQPWSEAYQPWADVYQPWADAYDTWRSGVSDLLARQPQPSTQRGCQGMRMRSRSGCERCSDCDCGPDPCLCRCCVTDADLLLEARVGERRIISLVIENRWRRERDIELELSSFSTPGENVQIKAAIVGQTSFKLEPCSEAKVIIAVVIGEASDQRELTDVTRCEVAYADLRIRGCDVRSVRLAVAVLPRDCDAYHVDCDCCCC